MAPEQIRGEVADRRSDVFAFGILLYEMVSGINPFKRASIETTFAAILREPIATLHDRMPAIPPSVDALLLQLLAVDLAIFLRRCLYDLAAPVGGYFFVGGNAPARGRRSRDARHRRQTDRA